MSDNHRFRSLTILVFVLALGLAAQPGNAAAKAGGAPAPSATWQLRFGGLGVDSDWTEDDYRTHRGRNESAGGGLGVSAEYRFSDRLGAEVGRSSSAWVPAIDSERP